MELLTANKLVKHMIQIAKHLIVVTLLRREEREERRERREERGERREGREGREGRGDRRGSER